MIPDEYPNDSIPFPCPIYNNVSNTSTDIISVSVERRDSESSISRSDSIYQDNTRRALLDHMSTHLKISKSTSDLLSNLSNDIDTIKESQALILKLLNDIAKYTIPLTSVPPSDSMATFESPTPTPPPNYPSHSRGIIATSTLVNGKQGHANSPLVVPRSASKPVTPSQSRFALQPRRTNLISAFVKK